MRLLDLLTEAPITQGSGLGPDRQLIFLDKIKKGSPFETDLGPAIIDPSEYDRLQELFAQYDPKSLSTAIKKIKTDIGDLTLSKFKKTEEFKGKAPADGEVAADKISNRGDVSEGLLSAALFAKLTARVNGHIAEIGPADAWAVVDSLKNSGKDKYSVTIKDASKTVVKDTITFTLILPEPAYLDFINPAKRPLLTNEMSSAVMFANSEDNENFSAYFYLNGKPDGIEIICDGGNPAKQKTSKVDIEVVVTDLKTGKKHKQRMDVSLKANAKQFGQVGMGSDKKRDFYDKQVMLWGEFGVDLEPIKDKFEATLNKKGLVDAVKLSYQYAANKLASLLAGESDHEEYEFIEDLVSGINYFATLHTPNVILVNFKGGGYEMISFKDMQNKLRQVELTAKYNTDVKWPQVDIVDANSGDVLLQVRVKMTDEERRNYIEKGPLMSKLLGTTVKPMRAMKKK